MSSSLESAWVISEHHNWIESQMLKNKVGFTSKATPVSDPKNEPKECDHWTL